MRSPFSHDNRAQAAARVVQFEGLTGTKEAKREKEDTDRTSTRSSLGPARYLLSLRVPVNPRGSRRFDEAEAENFREPRCGPLNRYFEPKSRKFIFRRDANFFYATEIPRERRETPSFEDSARATFTTAGTRSTTPSRKSPARRGRLRRTWPPSVLCSSTSRRSPEKRSKR